VQSPYIKLHILPHDANYGAARAEGFSMWNNPFVAAVDDIVVPEVFKRALNVLVDSNYSAYYSNHHVMEVEGNVFGQRCGRLFGDKSF